MLAYTSQKPACSHFVARILGNLRAATMMIVTHDIDEAIYLSNRVVIMGKNPGVVKKIVPVDLPFPRDRTDTAFLEIRGEIMKEFLGT